MLQRLGALLGIVIEEDADIGIRFDDADQILCVHILDLVAHCEVIVVCEELQDSLLVLQVTIIDEHFPVPGDIDEGENVGRKNSGLT